MLRFVLCAFVVVVIGFSSQISQAQSTGTATLTFSLTSPAGTFAPKHIDAVWVTDAAGNYIETLRKEAVARSMYLYTWTAVSGSDTYVDGTSSATATSYTNPITVTWDCLSKANTLLADGIYHLHIEFTDQHAQGPLADIAFTKGPSPVTITPADLTYIKGMQLNYVPDPATLTLLAAGALAVVRRRRK